MTQVAVTTFEGIDEVRAAVGTHLGYSDHTEVTQERVDRFAEATGDVDDAHSYLTLSISNELLPQILEVRGVSMGVNYGVDEIRFPSPVPVGSRLRAGAELVGVTDVPGGIQTLVRITLEVEGAPEPACVIDSLSRYLA